MVPRDAIKSELAYWYFLEGSCSRKREKMLPFRQSDLTLLDSGGLQLRFTQHITPKQKSLLTSAHGVLVT